MKIEIINLSDKKYFGIINKDFSLFRNYVKFPQQRLHRISISIFFFIAGLTFATWASRIPDIQNKLRLSEAALGGVLLSLPAGLMVSLPFSGWLVSKFGSRQMVVAGALVYPLILVPLAFSSNVGELICSLFLFGLSSNLVNIAMNTQAVGVEKIYGRSIMASFHGLWSIAGFTGALTGTLFISLALPPSIHFVFICIASGLLVIAGYKNTLPNDEKAQQQKLFVKPDKIILLLGLIAFCSMLCEGAMADWSGIYFKKVVQAPVAFITLGYVAFTGTMAFGRFTGDWLVVKLGVKKMLQLSGIAITSGLMLAVLLPNIYCATGGFLLVGFGVSSVVPIVYGLAGRSATMPASTALAAVSTISFLGFLIGPPVIGFIAQAINLRWAFSLIAILGFGTALLAGKIKNNLLQQKDIEMEPLESTKNCFKNGAMLVQQNMSHVINKHKSKSLENARKAFVAWPDDTKSSDTGDIEIIAGRTKNGGYVALPKE